jgi:hypothetical protein
MRSDAILNVHIGKKTTCSLVTASHHFLDTVTDKGSESPLSRCCKLFLNSLLEQIHSKRNRFE